jgi:hypothetical protein
MSLRDKTANGKRLAVRPAERVKKSKTVSANPLAMFASSLKSVAGRGENRFFHSLVGTVENSPAIYCWVGMPGRIQVP